MGTTIDVICYKSKVLKNNENPLMLRVTKNRKRRYLSVGISVNSDHWDFEKNKPKKNCPYKEQILQIIAQKTKEYQEQILDYKLSNKDFTARALVEKVKSPIKAKTVKEVFDLQIKRLRKDNRLRYAEMHELVLKWKIQRTGSTRAGFSSR